MKKLLLSSCLLLAALACENPALQRDGLVEWTFLAPATKASIDGKGAFSWNSGDAIAVWNSTGSGFVSFSTEGNGIFTAQAPADALFTGTAFFPASSANAVNSVSLPGSYSIQQLSQGAGIHMVATVTNDSNCLEFKHLTAYLTIQVPAAPAAMNSIVIESAGHSLSGVFEVNDDNGIIVNDGTATISVSFPAQAGQDIVFTVPIPVGEYQISITAGDGSPMDMINMHTGTVNFRRAHLYKLAPLSSLTGFSTACEVYDITDDNNWE